MNDAGIVVDPDVHGDALMAECGFFEGPGGVMDGDAGRDAAAGHVVAPAGAAGHDDDAVAAKFGIPYKKTPQERIGGPCAVVVDGDGFR